MLQVLKLREVIYEKSRGDRLERWGGGNIQVLFSSVGNNL
jgi:hypothetical protein